VTRGHVQNIEQVFRKLRKPMQTQPVVQKRIIKRPATEGQQGESTEAGEGQSTEEKKEDEL